MTKSEAQLIDDFSSFATAMKENSVRTVSFELDDKTYEIQYSEMSSEEDLRVSDEFKRWYAATYEKSEYDRLTVAGIQTQWRVWKMIQPHAKGLSTFEDFLKMPATLTAAIMQGIEKDLLARYPHLKA